ncbi:MAG: PhzF family phenazine biosynthesis protein [Steroidobacteraceae bacterium]
MRLAYHLVNVFTRDGARLSGNPLCVFEDAAALDEATMQRLARQFNLSETTFILPSARATARVRIFTPAFEMPFAGHPTLGTAHIVRRLAAAAGRARDRVELEMQAGIIPVEARGDLWTLTANEPRHRETGVEPAALAAAFGIGAGDLLAQGAGPRPLWVDTGSEQLIVPLVDAAAVERVAPRFAALAQLRSRQGRQLALVFAETGEGTVLARFLFEDGGAVREDPATGSACANLGGWYLATGTRAPLVRRVHQGERVQRPSTLLLSVDAERRIRVGGEVAWVGKGELEL